MKTVKQNLSTHRLVACALSPEAQAILCTAFETLMKETPNGKPYSLDVKMRDVLAKEPSVKKALRPLRKEKTVLAGFEFVRNSELSMNLVAPICETVNGENGITCPAPVPFDSINMAYPPERATHIKMVTVAAEFDPQLGVLKLVNLSSAILPWEGTATTVLKQHHLIKLNNKKPLFLALAVVYYQELQQVMFKIPVGKCNPLTVITVVPEQNPKP